MDQLSKAFERLGIETSGETISKFKKYMDMVLSWNEKVNLTAITEESDFIKKHFIDSVLCACFDELKNAGKIIDVGTGAGLPGVPLALVFPEKQFILIDSTAKKIKILNEIVKTLGLPNITAIHARAEELARMEEHGEKYDLCVSRAVANLSALSGYCLPFVKPGGSFIAYKGPGPDVEVKAAEKAIRALGGELCGVKKVYLEGHDLDHSFIVIKKTELNNL